MGQYYKVLLVNKKEVKVIQPDGWKLMEHSWYGNKSMERIEKLLCGNKFRVMRIGDYANISPLIWDIRGELLEKEDCISENMDTREILYHDEKCFYYLVNHSKKEYIQMDKQEHNEDLQDNMGWVVHPLGLLCRAETEEAGGDYHSEINQEFIGYWFGDEIEVIETRVDKEEWFDFVGYKDMTNILYFKE